MEILALQSIGFTQGAIKVYTAILEGGQASIKEIHEQTGLERRAIYDILNKLIERGFIIYVMEGRKKLYRCAPMNRLREEIKRRREDLDAFDKTIPGLETHYTQILPKTNGAIFRGKEGIKTIFSEMLNYEEVRMIGGAWYIMKEMPIFWKKFNRQRKKQEVIWYNLVLNELRSKKTPQNRQVQCKYLPKEFTGSPAVIFIYGNNIVNMLWSEGYFAFKVESKQIADNYRKYHKYLWDKVAKK